MSCFLSKARICGDSRAVSGLFGVLHCTDSIESRLASIHLSPENVTEGRTACIGQCWFLQLDKSVIAKMTVCAKQRHTYEMIWRPRKGCLYPSHQRHPRTGQQGSKEPVFREFKNAQGNPQNARCSSSSRFRYVKPITIKMLSKNKFIFLE